MLAKKKVEAYLYNKIFHQHQRLSLLTRQRFQGPFIKNVCFRIATEHQVQFLNKKANDYRILRSE